MTIERMNLMPGVNLTAVRKEGLKSSYWSVQLALPLCVDYAAYNAALPFLMNLGTARYRDQEVLSAAETRLGGMIKPTLRKIGDVHCIGFEGNFSALVEPARADQIAELFGELIMHPATKNGRFRPEYVNLTRDKLIRDIWNELLQAPSCVQLALTENIYPEEAYSVSKYGTLQIAEKLNVARLTSYYRDLLESAPIELYYCGSLDVRQVSLSWRQALMGLPRGTVAMIPRTDFKYSSSKSDDHCVEVNHNSLLAVFGFRLGFGMSDEFYPVMLVLLAMLQKKAERNPGYISASYDAVKGFLQLSYFCGENEISELSGRVNALLASLQHVDGDVSPFQKQVLLQLEQLEDDLPALSEQWLTALIGGADFDLNYLRRKVETVTAGQLEACAMQLHRVECVYCGTEKETCDG